MSGAYATLARLRTGQMVEIAFRPPAPLGHARGAWSPPSEPPASILCPPTPIPPSFPLLSRTNVHALTHTTHTSSHPSIDLAETCPLLRRTRFIRRVLLWFIYKSPSTSLRTCSILNEAGRIFFLCGCKHLLCVIVSRMMCQEGGVCGVVSRRMWRW